MEDKECRQARWQRKMRKKGRCKTCGQKAEKNRSYCMKHLAQRREWERIRTGAQKRYTNAFSYGGKPV